MARKTPAAELDKNMEKLCRAMSIDSLHFIIFLFHLINSMGYGEVKSKSSVQLENLYPVLVRHSRKWIRHIWIPIFGANSLWNILWIKSATSVQLNFTEHKWNVALIVSVLKMNKWLHSLPGGLLANDWKENRSNWTVIPKHIAHDEDIYLIFLLSFSVFVSFHTEHKSVFTSYSIRDISNYAHFNSEVLHFIRPHNCS